VRTPSTIMRKLGLGTKKVSGDTTKNIPKLDVNFTDTSEEAKAEKKAGEEFLAKTAKKAEAEAKKAEVHVPAAKEGTAAAALEKKMMEKEEQDKKAKEAPPPVNWDDDIFAGKPAVKAADANKAMKFAPAPRAKASAPPAAFGPRATPGNELDELD